MYMYTSAAPDAPKIIDNVWGRFNEVINYVLDGGVNQPVTSIQCTAPNKCTIILTNTVNFVAFQNILVSGATNPLYNGIYFIESVDTNTKTIICYKKDITSITAIEETTSIVAKVPPCGMTRLFGGVAEKRTVFKTKTGICYRIDDRDYRPLVTPPVVPNATNNKWLKVARICMAETFDSLDATSSRQYPFDASRPNENFQPDGQYIGQKFIIYNHGYSHTSSWYLTSDTNLAAPTVNWVIYADSKTMYIFFSINGTYISTSYNYNNVRSHIIGEFESLNQSIKNGLLFCNTFMTSSEEYNSNTSDFYYDIDSTFTNNMYNTFYSGCAVIYDNLKNNTTFINIKSQSRLGGSYSGGIGGLLYPNTIDNGIYISNAIITDNSVLYGKLREIKYIDNNVAGDSIVQNSESIANGSLIIINNTYYIAQRITSVYASYHQKAAMILVKVDRNG